MKKNYYAVLMAGGVGSRFWPVSTRQFPKQFHDMLGTGQSLIQKTFSRLARLIPEENIFILTNAIYADLVKEQLPGISDRQVVLEPAMRNTAPCILYAALKIKKENPDALMLVAPSDHWIEDEQAFTDDIEKSFQFCREQDALMTLGIKPSFPNTGYGYIEYDLSEDQAVKKVVQFREKPDYETAKQFLQQGNFLWNAGIFIWSVKSVLKAFEQYQQGMYDHFVRGFDSYNTDAEDEFISENYSKADNISIDYAIMEQSDKVFTIPASFDWNDLGTWGSLYDKLDKDSNNNASVNARLVAEDANGNLVRTDDDKIVIIDGISDYIVVDREEVLLVYPKSKEQGIKELLKHVKLNFGEQYG